MVYNATSLGAWQHFSVPNTFVKSESHEFDYATSIVYLSTGVQLQTATPTRRDGTTFETMRANVSTPRAYGKWISSSHAIGEWSNARALCKTANI